MRHWWISVALIQSLMLAETAAAQTWSAQEWYREEGYVAPSRDEIIACHGYGCARRTEIAIQPSWFKRVTMAMERGRSSPAAERQALSEAIRIYTAHLSSQFGGKPDEPRSPPGMSGREGQMDCLDETANTTSLLLVLKKEGLLVHHDVERPRSRGLFIDGRYPHVTAVIMDSKTRVEWAVDPWAEAPGQRPNLLPLEEWQKVS